MAGKIKDITKKRFGKLIAVKSIDKDKWGNYIWECKCDCGEIINITSGDLIKNKTKSCGCLQKEVIKNINISHGMRYTRFYKIWQGMKNRCYNKNDVNYKNYGERGIKVCDEWLKFFENFKDDMYESYLEHCDKFTENNTSIDRVNNDLGYSKENCKWSTRIEQNNNRRSRIDQKQFKATSPEGKEYIEINQLNFCKNNNLNQASVWRCLNNKQRHHKNWTFKYI